MVGVRYISSFPPAVLYVYWGNKNGTDLKDCLLQGGKCIHKQQDICKRCWILADAATQIMNLKCICTMESKLSDQEWENQYSTMLRKYIRRIANRSKLLIMIMILDWILYIELMCFIWAICGGHILKSNPRQKKGQAEFPC